MGIGYTQVNVDAKKLGIGHMIKSLCAIISDLVIASPETLPATTIGMFTHFFVLPIFLTKGLEDLVLGVGVGQVTNLAGGVDGH